MQLLNAFQLNGKKREEPQNASGISRDVRAAVTDEGLIVLDMDRGLIFTANPIGAAIWSAVMNGQSAASIAGVLSERYGVAHSEVEQHTARFMDALASRGLIAAGITVNYAGNV